MKYKQRHNFVLKIQYKELVKKLINVFLIIFFISNNVYSDETLVEIKQQLNRINRDISDLQKQIYQSQSCLSQSGLQVYDSY